MKKFSRLLALLLALVILSASLAGCTSQQTEAAIEAAAEIADMLSEDDGEEAASSSAEASSTAESSDASAESPAESAGETPDEHGSYTTKDDVALYIYTYGHLPENFVTKSEAQAAGWSGGSLEKYLPGKCIGGDRFGNREGLLPDADGRTWTECDINTLGASSRGAERIVFSNDGLIYYTGDHYESFELLYG